MRLLITGASGYIGMRLVKAAMAEGHETIAASRRRVPCASAWVPYDMQSGKAPAVDGPLDAIVHLAANTSGSSPIDAACEQTAALALVALAHRAGARLIFVSSQAAAAAAPTPYGRTKWLVEQDVLAANGCVVRPGQVYGGPLHGLFETLTLAVRRLPALPAFLPSPMVQPIHVDDLARGLLTLVVRPPANERIFCLAAAEPVSFTHFLSTIARARLRRRALFMPMPTFLVLLALRLAPHESPGHKSLERLTSLFNLQVVDSRPSLRALGLSLRPLCAGMQPSGSDRRRLLIAEANALLTYVLKARPAQGVVRRHVRAVERLREGAPLQLPALARRWPLSIALLDNNQRPADLGWRSDFRWRLHAATAIGEATGEGAQRFLAADRPEGLGGSVLRLCMAVAGELTWRVLAIVLAPWLRRVPPTGGTAK